MYFCFTFFVRLFVGGGIYAAWHNGLECGGTFAWTRTQPLPLNPQKCKMCQWNKRSTWDTWEFLGSMPRRLHLPVNGPREQCWKLTAQNKNWTADLQSRTRTPMDGWRCMMSRLEGPLGKKQQQHPWSLLSDCIIWILSLCIYSIIFLTMFAYMANLCLCRSVFVPMSQLGGRAGWAGFTSVNHSAGVCKPQAENCAYAPLLGPSVWERRVGWLIS